MDNAAERVRRISALVLVTVNIGGIFMTMMLSFLTHDPDKDLDAASRTRIATEQGSPGSRDEFVKEQGKDRE